MAWLGMSSWAQRDLEPRSKSRSLPTLSIAEPRRYPLGIYLGRIRWQKTGELPVTTSLLTQSSNCTSRFSKRDPGHGKGEHSPGPEVVILEGRGGGGEGGFRGHNGPGAGHH